MPEKQSMAKPSLNIWQALCTFSVKGPNNEVIKVNKNELLFLISKEDKFFVFKTENDKRIIINENAEKDKRIQKVF